MELLVTQSCFSQKIMEIMERQKNYDQKIMVTLFMVTQKFSEKVFVIVIYQIIKSSEHCSTMYILNPARHRGYLI